MPSAVTRLCANGLTVPNKVKALDARPVGGHEGRQGFM